MRFLTPIFLAFLIIGCFPKHFKNQKIIDDFEGKDTAVINLSSYGLDKIPFEVCLLKNVIKLTITPDSSAWRVYPPLSAMLDLAQYPPFRYIPDEIIQLKRLRSLNLSGLAIKNLPNKFSELSDLENLDLSWNKLDIQAELGKLKMLRSLKKLDIIGNKIDTTLIKQWQFENPKLRIKYSLK